MINQVHFGKIKLSKEKIYGKDLLENTEKYLGDGVSEVLVDETKSAARIYGNDAVFFKIEKYTNCSEKIVERLKLIAEDISGNVRIIIPVKDLDGGNDMLFILDLE